MSFCLQLGKKRENAVLVDKRLLVGVIGVEDHGLFASHLVVGGKLGGRRADVVHQAGEHLDFRTGAVGDVLVVDVAQKGEDLVLALVAGIKAAEVFGVSIISLADIVLKPGQELIIDTENMTATIDGENAIHLLGDDSDFFFLAQGDNIVTYSDRSGNRNINLKVMWKNRWV